jgi:hypothetical protein
MDYVPILRSDRPLPDLVDPDWHYEAFALGPSSVAGHYRCFTADHTHVVAILPDGREILSDAATHDGGYEACVLDGNRLAYVYPELETAPVVFDVVVLGARP